MSRSQRLTRTLAFSIDYRKNIWIPGFPVTIFELEVMIRESLRVALTSLNQ